MKSLLVDLVQHVTTDTENRVRVRAYRPAEGVVVVLFSEMPDNQPADVVRLRIDDLATDVRRGQMRNGESLLVIYHHEFDGQFHLERDGTYEKVLLTWFADRRRYHTPRFERIERGQVERLIGEDL